MLSAYRKWFEIFRSAYSSWAAVLGTILATVALCNLTFRAMGVSVTEALAWIFAAYQKTFHPPIDYLFSLFALRIPAAAKDVLVLYIAMGGVLYRTLSYKESSPLRDQFPNTWRTKFWDLRIVVGNIFAALFWPYFLRRILWRPSFLVRSSLGYHGRLPPARSELPSAEREEAMKTMLSYAGKDATVICNERQLLVIYAIALSAAALGLVVLNTALDRLSGA